MDGQWKQTSWASSAHAPLQRKKSVRYTDGVQPATFMPRLQFCSPAASGTYLSESDMVVIGPEVNSLLALLYQSDLHGPQKGDTDG
jgi:hypothetical protein